MDKKQLMKAISDKIGRDKAIDAVMQAYNTELLTTSIGRVEGAKPIGGPQRRDHLMDAMQRVWEVVQLAS
jgi:hypothetical protein